MTQPPPSTPTPRRFLLSKRQPPQSQRKTPGSGPSVFAGSQRFQTTPRFAPASSAQRPPSTPGFPGTIRPSRQRDPIHDELESSPPDAPPTVTRPARTILGAGTQRGTLRSTQKLKEKIESDSDIASDSQEDDEKDRLPPIGYGVNDSIEVESIVASDTQSLPEERTPKRRRISISPAHSWEDDAVDDTAGSLQEEDGTQVDSVPEDDELPDAPGGTPAETSDTEMDEDASVPDPNQADAAKPQPTFHRAPRFKVSEAEASNLEGLPPAFSPQRRRGPKYIAGGLAAELQSWLAEVKGWGGGGDRPPDLVMRIVVDEVRSGNRMYLVRGRRIVEDGSAREEIAARLMLAGEGRLTGLGQRAPVAVGSSVSISQPAWEIALEGTRWLVACDWAVS
ncbi:hypothetical protein CPLU01_11340 [Colletotrichum plurivorum]|uniref:Uncharacterized protein n=1 Tax=Colletotrichum plurivorum TaxID=2175906 RepID=A0A8H6N7T4_9PEZI|nr:hypothetical protein CPLU01_11340 [Colletotrichum plurivorum]